MLLYALDEEPWLNIKYLSVKRHCNLAKICHRMSAYHYEGAQ
jgi:hypothetical protein